MKLDAIASRGARKDFYDLYFLAQHISLDELLERGQEKYIHTRDFGMMALEGLVNFESADQDTPVETFPSISWEEVKDFCLKKIQRIGRNWFEDQN